MLVLADVSEAELSEDTYLQSEMVGVCDAMLGGASVVTTPGAFSLFVFVFEAWCRHEKVGACKYVLMV